MRKLATIRKIDAIDPIPGADAIEVASVGGWKVVVKKDEYKVGDLVVYCEIDSWIPTTIAPFLTKPGQYPKVYEGVEGERLRTVKLRGQISQGLVLDPFKRDSGPNGTQLISLFATYKNVDNRPYPLWVENVTGEGFYVGSDEATPEIDVTEALGIQKYEAPIPAQLAGEIKGLFPSFISKTDQERIQNFDLKLIEWKEKGLTFEVTEKLDGSSMTVYIRNGEVGVCSRNLDLKESMDNTFWKVATESGLVERLKSDNINTMNVAIQGELVGEGIQKNRYNLKGHRFYIFDIFDIDSGEYMAPIQRDLFLQYLHGVDFYHVPVLEHHFSIESSTIDSLLLKAEGKSVLNPSVEREGLVFKVSNGEHGDISFKAISNKFLLKGGE